MQKCWGGIQIYDKHIFFFYFPLFFVVFLQMHSTAQGFWLPQNAFPPALATAAGGEGWEGGFSTSLWLKAEVTFAH